MIQETNSQLAQLQLVPPPQNSAELADREREFKRLTDRLQGLSTAEQLQRLLGSEAQRKNERKCADATGKKLKNFGFRAVRVRFLGGFEITLLARYYARTQARLEKGKGAYFGLMLLGIYDHCSPALASEVAKLAAAMNSLEDARRQLAGMGVLLSVKQIAAIAYQFSQRARLRQKAGNMGISGNLRGKRVVVSTDGGRVRIRTNKRGKRTKKGRCRYRTDWREPKLLAIYVVDEQGKIEHEFTPVLDGTLQGPDAVFRLIEFYLCAPSDRSGDQGVVHCRRSPLDLEPCRSVMEAFGSEGGPMPGTGRLLSRRRASGYIGWFAEGVEQEAEARLDYPTSQSSQARQSGSI